MVSTWQLMSPSSGESLPHWNQESNLTNDHFYQVGHGKVPNQAKPEEPVRDYQQAGELQNP